MPKFYGQNKKRIDPRYFLNETSYECGKCQSSEGGTHHATMCKDRKVHKCVEEKDEDGEKTGKWVPPEDCGC